jgi:cobalamin biosynthesis protein CobT
MMNLSPDYGLRGLVFGIEMFEIMSAIVLLAAGVGRGLSRYYKRKTDHAA